MGQAIGTQLPLSAPRRFIVDLVRYAREVPSVPVARWFDLSEVIEPRRRHGAKPSWAVLFMKAFGLVAAEYPPLRRTFLTFPRMRLYEHPYSIGSLAVERAYQGEPGIFVGLFRAPELQSLSQLQGALDWYKTQPLETIGFYRQAIRISNFPEPLRRVLWWSTLHVSGSKKAKRLGTFGLTSYGALGAESLHPISPLTTTMTFGPIDDDGRVNVKLVYDHRVLDGAEVARRLHDIEDALRGPIRSELLAAPSLVPAPT
jgi:hypothetical protein